MASLSRDSQGRSMLSLIDWQHDHIDTGLSRVPANCHCTHGLRITPWSCFLARGWKNSSPTIITREISRGERDFYPYILNLNHAAFGSDQKGKSSGQFFPKRKKVGNETNISHIDSCVWRAFSRETGKEDTMRSKFFWNHLFLKKSPM